jgi:hypothetical protein
MVGSALIMLFVYQVGTAVSDLASTAAGGVTAVVVGVVIFLTAQRADMGPGNKALFLVPAVLFLVLPLALKAWHIYSTDTSALAWLVGFTPLLLGFLLPVLLLWLTYVELRKRASAADEIVNLEKEHE